MKVARAHINKNNRDTLLQMQNKKHVDRHVILKAESGRGVCVYGCVCKLAWSSGGMHEVDTGNKWK